LTFSTRQEGLEGRRLYIAEVDAVSAWIGERQTDILVHLAAVTAVTASVKDPRLWPGASTSMAR
jgi:nucleoside-diphosphate-sugar epimerase